MATDESLSAPGAIAWATRSAVVIIIAVNFIPTGQALDWVEVARGVRSAPLPTPSSGKNGFVRVPSAETGISFTNLLGEARGLTNHILLNGAGLALGDVDGDGWCDVYLCGLDNGNRLYRNLGGWRFVDVTTAAGVACAGQDSTGACFADVDGDGDLDLLVNSIGGGTRLFINDGQGHFSERTGEAGLRGTGGATSLALADIDGDGTLDLYVANYRAQTIRDSFRAKIQFGLVDGRRGVTRFNDRSTQEADLAGRFSVEPDGSLIENGEADILYRNDGKGNFSPIAFTNGAFLDEKGEALAHPPFDWGLSAKFHDINGDGAPDLYVCNDFASPDRIWLNDGHGRFRAIAPTAIRKSPWFSMGVDFADINRDGFDDFFVSDMLSRSSILRHTQENDHRSVLTPQGVIFNRPQYVQSMLYLNRGDGDFSEIACFSGVEASDWSWSPVFLDVDLDGFEDLLVTTGFERNVQDRDIASELEKQRRARALSDQESLLARRRFPRLAQDSLAFRNLGNLRFAEVGREWGFAIHGVCQAMALADLDNDGDLDVVINPMNESAILLRNECPAARLAVRLHGRPPNTFAIGARVKVTVSNSAAPGFPKTQTKEIECGGRYLGGDSPECVFAAGDSTNLFAIEVAWRSGGTTRISGAANRIYELEEILTTNSETWRERGSNSVATPILFEDVSARLHHRHEEDEFNDFEQQLLLPKRFSRLGPGVLWLDLNADGWDDLVIGNGHGRAASLFLNDQHGGFTPSPSPTLTIPRGDITGLAGWRQSPSTPIWIAGISTAEAELSGQPNFQSMGAELPVTSERLNSLAVDPSGGPVSMADLDGSGNLTLFVGGRWVPRRYPEPANSALYHLVKGRWQLDSDQSSLLAGVGLVSGSVFSDLTGDGFPELILATEWGPIRLFRNIRGKLEAWDPPVQCLGETNFAQLSQMTGWWNGVTTADLDEDGRLDIIASNWGRNSKYESHRERPPRIYYGDFDQDGRAQLLESYWDSSRQKWIPWATWDRLGGSFFGVRARFQSFHQYAEADVDSILGDAATQARFLSVTWLDSTVFFNRGDHFEAQSLPAEAQWSPAFAVCAGDLDGDGHEDLFLSQNFFATDARTARQDAGRGLCLRGMGDGRLVPWTAEQSGIRVYGEQRGAALADYDQDGRMDLVVAQNAAESRLFHNVSARQGVRVHFTAGTPPIATLGVQARRWEGKGVGPVREVKAGAGYWSEDAPAQIWPPPGSGARLWMGWPGGETNLVDWPVGVREFTVDRAGGVRVSR